MVDHSVNFLHRRSTQSCGGKYFDNHALLECFLRPRSFGWPLWQAECRIKGTPGLIQQASPKQEATYTVSGMESAISLCSPVHFSLPLHPLLLPHPCFKKKGRSSLQESHLVELSPQLSPQGNFFFVAKQCSTLPGRLPILPAFLPFEMQRVRCPEFPEIYTWVTSQSDQPLYPAQTHAQFGSMLFCHLNGDANLINILLCQH